MGFLLLLLACTLPYNFYYWFRQLPRKEKRLALGEEESKFIKSERMRIEELNSLFIKKTSIRLMLLRFWR